MIREVERERVIPVLFILYVKIQNRVDPAAVSLFILTIYELYQCWVI